MNYRQVGILFGIVGGLGLTAYGVCALLPRSPLTHVVAARDSGRSVTRTDVRQPSKLPASRPALSNYSQTIRENLFTAPQPKPLPAKPAPPPAPAAPVFFPPPPDPLADAVYSGTVTMDGKTTALIESRSTKQGVYVGEGEEWQGFRILSVSPTELTLLVNGAPRVLAKSDAINLVPLSNNAPGGGQNQGNSPIVFQQMMSGENGATAKLAIEAIQQANSSTEMNRGMDLQILKQATAAETLELGTAIQSYDIIKKR